MGLLFHKDAKVRRSDKSIYDVEGSFDWIRAKLSQAVREKVSALSATFPEYDYYYVWVKDIFPDTVVIEDEQAQALYEASWSIDESGSVSIGDFAEIKAAYVAKRREDAKKSSPAIEGRFVRKDASQHLAYGAVLIPGEPDYDGDIVSRDKVQKVAHKFVTDFRYHDSMHEVGDPVADTVESWLTDSEVVKSFPDGTEVVYPEGTWMMGVKVHDDYWPRVESGDIRGFSIMAVRESDLAAVKSANKSVEAAFKRTTLKDLEEEGEWVATAVSLVDDPAVGNARFYATKARASKKDAGGLFAKLFGSGEGESDEDESDQSDVRNVDESGKESKNPAGTPAGTPLLFAEFLGGREKSEQGVDPFIEALVGKSEQRNESEDTNTEVKDMSAMDDFVAAIKASNRELLKEAGVIKEEPSEQEKQAEAFGTALTEALKPLQESIERLQVGSSETVGDSGSAEGEEETEEVDEEAAAAIKRLEDEVAKLKRGMTSSKSLTSEDDEDDDEDEDYDDVDDGRDFMGRRIRPLGEVR